MDTAGANADGDQRGICYTQAAMITERIAKAPTTIVGRFH